MARQDNGELEARGREEGRRGRLCVRPVEAVGNDTRTPLLAETTTATNAATPATTTAICSGVSWNRAIRMVSIATPANTSRCRHQHTEEAQECHRNREHRYGLGRLVELVTERQGDKWVA